MYFQLITSELLAEIAGSDNKISNYQDLPFYLVKKNLVQNNVSESGCFDAVCQGPNGNDIIK